MEVRGHNEPVIMPEVKQCRKCGALVPLDAPLGNCPTCLVDVGLGLLSNPAPIFALTRFGDYELIEVIGRGGMGVVYKARQLSLNRLIALKMLTPNSAAFPRVADRLRLEAETAASLHHPNIVTIHEVGEEQGHPFFTMEWVEGSGMDRFIEKTGYRFPHPPSSALPRIREPQAPAVHCLIVIARAVDYAHKHGVLHRDLKPANVVIDAAGVPHLTDFGLAKILGPERARQTESGSILGTPAYMAPEQALSGTKRASTAADIYSLGAVFYEMLTGHPPFRADTPLETLRRAADEEPVSPHSLNAAIDADLATICLKCLEKDPARRYDTALALAEDLERWLRHEPIEARPVGTVGQFWRWCHREPRLAGMAVGIFVLLLATTVLALTLYYREKEGLIVAKEEKAQQKAILFGRIEKDWILGGRTGVRVYPEELALMADRSYVTEGNERLVVVGVHLPGQDPDPLQILQRFAPLANCLQTNLAFPADIPLLFALQMYTTYSNAMAGMANGEVDLMLLSSASYIRHRTEDKELQPLVHFASYGHRDVPTAIFCSAGAGIGRLADLKGRSLALAGPDLPLIEDSIKAALWHAGLRRQDFKRIEFLSRGLVVSAVRRGLFDAGVTTLHEFVRLTNAGVRLELIQEVAVPGYLWVSTGKLEEAATKAIRARLLAIQDQEVLAPFEALTGFLPVEPRDFDGAAQSFELKQRFDGIQ